MFCSLDKISEIFLELKSPAALSNEYKCDKLGEEQKCVKKKMLFLYFSKFKMKSWSEKKNLNIEIKALNISACFDTTFTDGLYRTCF